MSLMKLFTDLPHTWLGFVHSGIFTKCIICLPNDTVTLYGQNFYQSTYYIFCHFSHCRWIEMCALLLSHWYNFVLFLWSYAVQQISQFMWLSHEVLNCIHILKFYQGSICTQVCAISFVLRFLVYNVPWYHFCVKLILYAIYLCSYVVFFN